MLHALHPTPHIGFLSLSYPLSPTFLVETKTQGLSNLSNTSHPQISKAGGQTHSDEPAFQPLPLIPQLLPLHEGQACFLLLRSIGHTRVRKVRAQKSKEPCPGDSLRL